MIAALFGLALAAAGWSVPAQDPQALLAEAERAYRAGRYAEAAEAWRAVLERFPWDGRIEYDLGNCAYRLGRYAEALWRYERARRRLGARNEVVFNRDLCLRRLGRAGDPAPGLYEALARRLREARPATWFFLGLGLEALALAGLWVLLARRPRPLAALLFLAAFLAAGAAFRRAVVMEPDRPVGAVVLVREGILRAEPRPDLEPRARLARGVRARVLETAPAWVLIEVGGTRGWIERAAVGLY